MTEPGDATEPEPDSPTPPKNRLKTFLTILVAHAVVIVYIVFATLKYFDRRKYYLTMPTNDATI